MKGNELPNPGVDLADWVNKRGVKSKTELTALSVSSQVLVSELFEEVDVLASQITSISIPEVKSALQDLDSRLVEARHHPATSHAPIAGSTAKLADSLQRMTELARARANIESVKSQLVTYD